MANPLIDDMAFEDFRGKIRKKPEAAKTGRKTENAPGREETQEQVRLAEGILKGFVPWKKGGGTGGD